MPRQSSKSLSRNGVPVRLWVLAFAFQYRLPVARDRARWRVNRIAIHSGIPDAALECLIERDARFLPSPAAPALDLVFRLRLLGRLPLHVAWSVSAAARE